MTKISVFDTHPFFITSRVLLQIIFGVIQFALVMGLFYAYNQNHDIGDAVINLGRNLPYVGPMQLSPTQREADLTKPLEENSEVYKDILKLRNAGVSVKAEKTTNLYILHLNSVSSSVCRDVFQKPLSTSGRFGFQTINLNGVNLSGKVISPDICLDKNTLVLSYPIEK